MWAPEFVAVRPPQHTLSVIIYGATLEAWNRWVECGIGNEAEMKVQFLPSLPELNMYKRDRKLSAK